MISVWLGAAAVGFKSDSAPAGVRARKCLVIIIVIIIIKQTAFSLFTRWCRVGFEPYGGSV